MSRPLTAKNMAGAVARARKRSWHITRARAGEVELRCARGHLHVVRFRRGGRGELYAECVLGETGELCPSELGPHNCYHKAAAAWLFEALEAGIGREGAASWTLAAAPRPGLTGLPPISYGNN
jgi:hypothetical protein